MVQHTSQPSDSPDLVQTASLRPAELDQDHELEEGGAHWWGLLVSLCMSIVARISVSRLTSRYPRRSLFDAKVSMTVPFGPKAFGPKAFGLHVDSRWGFSPPERGERERDGGVGTEREREQELENLLGVSPFVVPGVEYIPPCKMVVPGYSMGTTFYCTILCRMTHASAL
ncbi:hypothetical protein B296_00035462 [Ensete ventricosum]|uniref:Uncharacterized protein n=1 Tax=Ensete ventricosum TaxID=4639 RepID=A0A426YB15_ENSVE|nr:hypothetical protein B296_00035462 [Ensete ventricosum]